MKVNEISSFTNDHLIPVDLHVGENPNLNELSCYICFGVAFKPIMITCCERILCLYCLNSLVKTFNKCPVCNEKIIFEKISRFVQRLYDNLSFYCPIKKCNEKIHYSNFFKHIGSDCKLKTKDIFYCKDCQEIYIKNENGNHICYELLKVSDEGNETQNKLVSLILEKVENPNQMYNTEVHKHRFKLTNERICSTSNRGWICDICDVKNEKSERSFYCSECDYDVCVNCIEIIRKGKPNKNLHSHKLKLTMRKLNWVSDCCKKRLTGSSWYCILCDFDICINCYWKNVL